MEAGSVVVVVVSEVVVVGGVNKMSSLTTILSIACPGGPENRNTSEIEKAVSLYDLQYVPLIKMLNSPSLVFVISK